MNHTIIVLFGGSSDERHVSVASGQNVLRQLPDALAWFWSLDGAVHDIRRDDLLSHQRPFEIDFVPSRPPLFRTLEQALDARTVENPVFFLALHGGAGEDGTVQRMMEERGIPFTGSGAAASAAAFDKNRAKELVRGRVRTAESEVARSVRDLHGIIASMLSRHERIVLKPLAAGSSRGLFFLNRGEDPSAVERQIADLAIPYIVEQFIAGRELTVGVAEHDGGPIPLPVIEIEVDTGHTFDYEGKYLGKGTREICPAKIPESMAGEARQAALAAHLALGCEGYSRSDFVAAEDGVYFLELNTLPGLTTSSLVPQELEALHIPFRTFLDRQIELALERANASPQPAIVPPYDEASAPGRGKRGTTPRTRESDTRAESR